MKEQIFFIALLTSQESVPRLIVGDEEEQVRHRAEELIIAHNQLYKMESLVKYNVKDRLTCYLAI